MCLVDALPLAISVLVGEDLTFEQASLHIDVFVEAQAGVTADVVR